MRDRRRSFSISLNFCQTTLYSRLESASGIHVWHKEVIINWCANIYSRRNTGRPVEKQVTLLITAKQKVQYDQQRCITPQLSLLMFHFVAFHYDRKLMYCGVLFLRSFLCKEATKKYVCIQKWPARWEFDRSSPQSGRTLSVDRPLFSALLVLCHGQSLLGLLSHLLTWLSHFVPCKSLSISHQSHQSTPMDFKVPEASPSLLCWRPFHRDMCW